MHDMAKCSNTTNKMLGIRWTIQNVSQIEEDEEVIGPDLYLAPECMFQIFFKKNEDYIYVYLCNKSDAEITIERTISLCSYDNKKLHEENVAIFTLEKGEDVDVSGDAKVEILNKLTYDVMIIDLCVIIKENVIKKLNPSLCDIDPERKLKEDFKTMLENPVNSDVSLQVGDERILAHWSVLSARSPYFKRMFDSGMQESIQNSVTITDLSIGNVKNLTQFLYTADFIQPDDIQELFDLYYAADKYEVMDLRALCGRKIVSNATIDNVCEIFQLSRRYNDKDMKKGAIDFIRSHSNAIFQTEGWKKLEASEPEIAELITLFCN